MRPRKSNRKLEPANSLEKKQRPPSKACLFGSHFSKRSKTDSPRDHLPETEIDFAELGDGSRAEMIEDPAIPTKSLLAVYRDGTVQCTEKWRNGDRVIIPLPRVGRV